jgi:hypothetical protein
MVPDVILAMKKPITAPAWPVPTKSSMYTASLTQYPLLLLPLLLCL